MTPKLPEIKRIKKMSKKEMYDYGADINWDDCIHKRPKIFEVKPAWQEDTVTLIIECKDCHKVGDVDGVVKYDDEEVQWQ